MPNITSPPQPEKKRLEEFYILRPTTRGDWWVLNEEPIEGRQRAEDFATNYIRNNEVHAIRVVRLEITLHRSVNVQAVDSRQVAAPSQTE